jgi:hypothetical protein
MAGSPPTSLTVLLAKLRPRIHCSALAGPFPSVPTAAQLCPKLPESAEHCVWP